MAVDTLGLEFTPLFPDEDEAAILDRMRGWANEGLDPDVDADVWVDTREGSHWYMAVRPMVIELARIYDLMGTEVPASAFVLWAWGDYLDDLAEAVQVTRLAATAGSGEARFTGPEGTIIAAGTTVSVEPPEPDAEVPEFEVVVGGTIPGPITTPTPTSTPHSMGGMLAAGTRLYALTAFDAAGETEHVSPAGETSAVVPSGGTGSVTLSWSAVAGASGYRIYLWNGSAFERLAEVINATSWEDTGAAVPDPSTLVPITNQTGGVIVLAIVAAETGIAGNVGVGGISIFSTPPPTGTTVQNTAPTTGGTEPETDDALRDRVLAAFRGQGSGNRADYRRWASAYAGVGHVTVIPLWDGPGTVLVVVTDPSGQPVAAETVAGLQQQLDPTPGTGDGLAPVGATVTVMTATLLDVAVAVVVEMETGYTLDGDGGTVALRASIEAALAEYINGVEPGGEIVFARVLASLMSVTGVHDVGSLTVNTGRVNLAVPANPPQVPKLTTPAGLTEGSV